MNEQQLLYNIALTRIGHFSLASALHLYRTLGSGEEIFLHRNEAQDLSLIHISEPTRPY